jgi:hypothetical protein
MSGAGAQHLLDVDVIAWPTLKLPSSHVAENGGMRVQDRTK